MKKLLTLPVLLALLLATTTRADASAPFASSSAVLLNEVLVNPPGTDDSREHVELRGPAGASLQGLTLLEVSGNGTNIGRIFLARPLDGLSLGSNGLLILGDQYGSFFPYWFTPAETPAADLNHPRVKFDNDTTSFLLVTNFSGAVGDDLDANDDGTWESTPWALTLDSVGWLDGSPADHVYAAASLSQRSGTPDAATRRPDNTTPNALAAWFNGDLSTNASDPDGITYDVFRASSNLPAQAVLTPGDTNYWSTARQAPLLEALTAQTVLTGQLVQVEIEALPTDGDTVTLNLPSGPVDADFGSTNEFGLFTWMPLTTGLFTVAFTATDVDGVTTSYLQITVIPQAPVSIRITEIMSKTLHPDDTDWFELMNHGVLPVDLVGCSWDDNSENPGSAGFNGQVLQPGEVYVISAAPVGTEDAFRTTWGRPATSRVWCMGAPFQNFSSGGDELHVYDTHGIEVDGRTIPAAVNGRTFAWASDGVYLGTSEAGFLGAYVAPDNGAGAPGSDVGSPGRVPDASADADEDGQTDVEEFFAGTDAGNPNALFRWQASASGAAGGSFAAVSGHWYSVEARTSLIAGGWTVLTNFTAASNWTVQIAPGTQQVEMLRIRAGRP